MQSAGTNLSQNNLFWNNTFLLENTTFGNSSNPLQGYYLESWTNRGKNVYYLIAANASLSSNVHTSVTPGAGVRPAIEVPLSKMKY